MTETTTNDAAKKAAEDKAKRDKASKETAERLAKQIPTPTQEENDRTASGEHITEHADDGRGPEPNTPTTKQREPKRPQGGGYATRDARPRE
jgi:hypothetical protein